MPFPGAAFGLGSGLGGGCFGSLRAREGFNQAQAQAAMAQHHGMMHDAQVHTPPMSRSASEKSDEVGGGKRKRDGDEGVGEVRVKKVC